MNFQFDAIQLRGKNKHESCQALTFYVVQKWTYKIRL